MPKHKTVKVRVGAVEAAIDVKIAPLIREIWKAGIETSQCCECHTRPGLASRRIWVQFRCCRGLCSFLEIITAARTKNAGLYARISYHWASPRDLPGLWHYNIDLQDWAIENEYGPNGELQFTGPPMFLPAVDLYMPRNDYAQVLQQMRRFNRLASSSK